MNIQVGNIYYFLYIIIAVIYALVLFLCLRKAKDSVKHKTLLVILFLNFGLHFLKLAFEPYRSGLPGTIRKVTFENICAVSTLLFPFIFLKRKQNILHDYMFFIGICGGLGALAFPTEAIGKYAFAFDTIRFYFCHINLIVIPVVACALKLYRPRIKKFWAIPLLFMGQLLIIMINELILIRIGWVQGNLSTFLDRSYRNNSFIFGLTPEFDKLAFLIDPLVPWFFKTDVFNINHGVPFYTPILWMTIPLWIYFPIVYALLTSPFWISDLVKKGREKKLQKQALQKKR